MPPAIGFHFLTVVRKSIRRLHLFKLIFALEELRQRDFLVADRRDEEQIELSDVIDCNSRGAVSRRTNRGEVKRKSDGVIELFPARDQFQRQVTVLQLLIVRAVDVPLLELRLLPLFYQLGKILELSIDQRAARQISGEPVGVLARTS